MVFPFEQSNCMVHAWNTIALRNCDGSIEFRFINFQNAEQVFNVFLRYSDAARVARAILRQVENTRMEPSHIEMLDVARRKLAERGYQETGPGLISPAPAEPATIPDVSETLVDPVAAEIAERIRGGDPDYVSKVPPAGATLLPLNVTETRFLEFWRSVPAWNVEEAGAEFQRVLNREADRAELPFVGRVSYRYADGTEKHLRSFAASTRGLAYANVCEFIDTQPQENHAACIITIEPRA